MTRVIKLLDQGWASDDTFPCGVSEGIVLQESSGGMLSPSRTPGSAERSVCLQSGSVLSCS